MPAAEASPVGAATHRDLNAEIERGKFREDLFYRLNVFPLEVPPLRERREDIPLLVNYFLDRYARKAGKSIRRVNKRALQHLQSYPWPGNVRELQNVIERSVILRDSDEFTIDENWLSTKPTVDGPAEGVQQPGCKREGNRRGGPTRGRRARLRAIRSRRTAGNSPLDPRIEDPCLEDQQDPLPPETVKESVNEGLVTWRRRARGKIHYADLTRRTCRGVP